MIQSKSPDNGIGARAAATSAIFLSFIVVLEIIIMISPFAFFFYAVINPFLLALNESPMTRWLTAFFLSHMIVPPNEALKVLRILGSVFFVGGTLLFFVCAIQVYAGKLLKKGVASKGFYSLIRHPQYLGLGLTALGLVIIWPRFLTLTLFALMLFLYYLLAKNEERRMINRFGKSYIAYMERTGMFLPHFIEKLFMKSARPRKPVSMGKAAVVFLGLIVFIVGSGFILRAYVVRHLPLEQVDRIDVITITRDDLLAAKQVLPFVLQDSVVASKLQLIPSDRDHRILAYFIPADYIMQGLIANTGEAWKLFARHRTLAMIVDNTFHPFARLTSGHGHPGVRKHDGSGTGENPAMRRRIIFLEITTSNQELKSAYDDFGINIQRTPLFFVDVNLHPREIFRVQETQPGNVWGSMPTPMF
jgi:protein-S-isoprenylcysteine O-methyltransferase Ste14